MADKSNACICRFAIVAAIFLKCCFHLGVVKSIGLFMSEISVSLRTTPTDIGVALGVLGALGFCPGPIFGVAYRRLMASYRRLMLVPGALMPVQGVIMASIAATSVQLTAGLALLGIGNSLLMMCAVLELNKRAGRHFGVLYSIGLMGYSAGLIVVPLAGEFIMSVYGWRGALFIFGGIMCHFLPLVLLFSSRVFTETELRETTKDTKQTIVQAGLNLEQVHYSPITAEGNEETRYSEVPVYIDSDCDQVTKGPTELDILPVTVSGESPMNNGHCTIEEQWHNEKREVGECSPPDVQTRTSDDTLKSVNVSETITDWLRLVEPSVGRIFHIVVFRYPYLTLFLAQICLFGMICGGWHSFLIPRAIDSGVSVMNAVLLSGLAAGANFVGRILTAFLFNRWKTHLLHVYLIVTVVNASALLCDVLVFTYDAMMGATIVITGCMSIRATLESLILRELSDPDHFHLVFGLDTFFFGLGGMIGSSLCGVLGERLASFNASFLLLVITEVPVFALTLLSKCLHRRMTLKKN